MRPGSSTRPQRRALREEQPRRVRRQEFKMSQVISLEFDRWDHVPSAAEQDRALGALERGQVVWMPNLAFAVDAEEQALMSPALATDAKNVSLDPRSGALKGGHADAPALQRLQAMMQRFADGGTALLGRLLPGYGEHLHQGRTSFRPVEIAGRQTSWRKDDTRLHVDSFPSSPTHGSRILRVFSNINPQGRPRRWRLGEPFDAVARRFIPGVPAPLPGSATLLQWLHVTKSHRSAYDHYMLQLHDRMKADMAYQAGAEQSVHEFPAGGSWIVFTDQASHAATHGQHALEQTFLLPMAALREPELAPLRVLEKLVGRALA
jgi:hypothetical protein